MSPELITFAFRMKIISKFQKNVLFRLREGYELRIDVSKQQFSPKLIKPGGNAEPASMKTITNLRAKKLIKDSEKYNPPYHYYVLTEEGKQIKL